MSMTSSVMGRLLRLAVILPLMIAVMYMAMAPGTAWAAAPASIDQIVGATKGTDKSVEMLNGALGSFFSSPFSSVGGSTTLLGGLLLIFNGAIFLVAVFWGTYNILRGIVSTAHEGQVLGQRLSAVWLPIRMVTGIAGVVPVFGGFNLAQVALVTCAAIGIGIANMMWSGALTLTSQFTASLNPAIGTPTTGASFRQAAYALFATEVCRAAKQEEEGAAASSGGPVAGADALTTRMIAGSDLLALTKYGTARSPDLCGHVALFRKEDGRAPSTFGFRVANVQYRTIAASVQNGYGSAYAPFATSVRTIAERWYLDRQSAQATQGAATAPVPTDALDAAANGYSAAAQLAAATSVQAGANTGAIADDVKAKMLLDGWAGAGAWYATFAEVSAAITDAVRSIEIRVESPVGATGSSLMAEASSAYQKSFAAGKAASAKPAEGDSGFSVVKAIMGDYLGVSATNSSGEWSIGQVIIEKAVGVTAGASGGAGLTNPIIMFKNMGDWLMVAGEAMHAGIFTISNAVGSAGKGGEGDGGGGMLSKLISKLPFGGHAMAAIQGTIAFLPVLATIMIGLGALMAIYIPMVPFITWMGGMVQYLVIVFEGLVAMTLGALSHMEAEGEGMGQRTERAYIFLLNVIARPACMLLGFFAASALVTALGTFQTHLFMGALANAQGNSITGLITILGFLVIFFLINWTLIQGMFNMIFLIPDNVIGMVGQGSSSDIGREVEGKLHGMFLGFGRRLDGGFARGVMGAGAQGAKGAAAGAAGAGAEAAGGRAAGGYPPPARPRK